MIFHDPDITIPTSRTEIWQYRLGVVQQKNRDSRHRATTQTVPDTIRTLSLNLDICNQYDSQVLSWAALYAGNIGYITDDYGVKIEVFVNTVEPSNNNSERYYTLTLEFKVRDWDYLLTEDDENILTEDEREILV